MTSLYVIVRWRNLRWQGTPPVKTFTLVALLFTIGLDMCLVMLPLTEFPVYADDAACAFTNPLAIEFGMWGPLVWMMYFLTAFYFIKLEPRLQVLRIPLVKWVYNPTVIATCAFTGYLSLTALPSYVPGLPASATWAIVIVAIGIPVHSSGEHGFMKWLAILSTWGFGILVFVVLVLAADIYAGIGLSGGWAGHAATRCTSGTNSHW